MKIEHFRISYDGLALMTHQMEVRSLAPALLALGDLIEGANAVLNGEDSKVSVSVKGSFKTGSFGIDIQTAQSVTSHIVDFLSGREVVALSVLLGILGFNFKDAGKGLISLVKWLKGRRITKTETLDGFTKLYVEDDMIEVENAVYDLLRDVFVRKALEGVIYEPLQQEGIDTFAVGTDDKIVEIITEQEANYFSMPVSEPEQLNESTSERWLLIESPSFKDGNKWKFTDGNSNFFAIIEDVDFLKKIDEGSERFGKGDWMRVTLKTIQVLIGQKLSTEHYVLEVHQHKKGREQLTLI